MTVVQRICFALILATFLPLTLQAKQNNVQEFQQAEAAFQKYDFMTAERNYQLALIKFPDMGNLTAYIKNQLAYCKRYQGQIEEAVTAYEKVRQEHPDSPVAGNVQENIARTYYEAGDYTKAGPAFEKLAQDLETEEVEASQVSAASAGKIKVEKMDKDFREKKNEAYGYAELSYFKTKKILKANSMKKKKSRKK